VVSGQRTSEAPPRTAEVDAAERYLARMRPLGQQQAQLQPGRPEPGIAIPHLPRAEHLIPADSPARSAASGRYRQIVG
jgi:hypothetical protein